MSRSTQKKFFLKKIKKEKKRKKPLDLPESYIQSTKFLRPQSEAGLQSLRITPIPSQANKWPQPWPLDMDGKSYSSFSLCEDPDHDYDHDHRHYQIPEPPPSFNTSIFLTPGHNSACDSDIKIEAPRPVKYNDGTQLASGDSNKNNNNKRSPHTIGMKAKLRKTVTLHSNVLAKRAGMRELRAELGLKREEELQQRVALMKTINAFCAQIGAQQQDMKMIELGHEQLQSTMNVYMELERKYDAEEDELRRREDELDMAMERMSAWLQDSDATEVIQGNKDDQAIDTDEGDDRDEDNDGCMFGEDMHPLMVEYLQHMGDIEIWEERLEEIDGEYQDILDKQQLRERVNVPLDEESQEFLSSYKDQRAKAQKEFDTVIHEANRLREMCELRGLLHNSTQNVAVMDNDANNDDDDEIGLSKAIQNYQHQLRDPLKTTMEEDMQPFFETHNSSSKSNRSIFINKWLLHQLRHSSLQISRLKALPELHGLGYDEMAISQQALDVWFLDDAVMAEPPVSPPITENADADTNVSTTVARVEEEKDLASSRRRSDPVRGPKKGRVERDMRRVQSCTIL